MPTTTTLSDGTYVQVSEPVDSQHVRVDHYSASGTLLNEQAWDVSGASFEMPTITPTTDAGYVIDLVNQEHATGVTIEKVASDGTVFTTPSLGAPLTAQLTTAVTATAGGGFVVTANEAGSPQQSSFEDFNATGQLQHSANIDGFNLTATAEQGGGYVLSWSTFTGGTQSLTVDATHSPDLTAPAAPDIVAVDHTTGQTIQNNGQTNDPHPTIELRVTSDEVGDTITNGPGGFSHLITQADLSQGFVVLPDTASTNDQLRSDTYRLDKPDGVDASTTFSYFYSGTASPPPASPPPASPPPATGGQSLQAQDGGSDLVGGAGADTLVGAHGPDTMTGNGGADHFVFNEVPWQPATITDFQVGTDQFDVTALLSSVGYTGSDPVGDGYIKFFTDSNGGSLLYFDPTPSTNPWGDNLGDVEHVAPSQLSDASLVGFGGTASPPPASPPPVSPPPASPPPASPPPASGGQTLQAQDGGSHLVGGSGADTLIGAHGPDVMTGNGGADHFTFTEVPWQPATITDFQVGVDQFDVTALLQQAGYTGHDPVGDGYIKFFTDSNGGTLLYFDATPASNPWGSNLGDVQGVDPSQLSDASLVGFGGTASPPPASPPPASPPPASPPPAAQGQTLQAQDGGSNLVGGSGADTLIGAHGPDIMTGNGGADHFVFPEVPWQPATVTDFQVGVDQFDVRALLQQAGYTGSDPVADGYIKFFTDSNGGTLLYFDPTPASNPWGDNLGDIQNVAPSSLSVGDLIWH